jgi:hypothetical protein
MPSQIALDNKGHIISRQLSGYSLASVNSGITFQAQAAEPPKLKYQSTWKVVDTHNTKYHTTFVVKDSDGRHNSITIAWSDACGIPIGGDWSLSSNVGNCTISSVDGVDAGNATIDTYTLTLNSTFAFNSGKSISITNGTIAIGSGGIIQQTYLWVHDVDGDGYPGAAELAQDTQPVGYSRRNLGNPIDCDDSNANIYQTPSDVSGGQCVGPQRTESFSLSFGAHRSNGVNCDNVSGCSGNCVYYANGPICGGYSVKSTNNASYCGDSTAPITC